MIKIGIIGGSGLDDPNLIKDYKEIEMNTPYGSPSSKLTLGKISGSDVVILARHGKKHTIMPGNVNNRANIWALKELGCTHILASTACGSLREEIEPGHLVLPDQFIDKTTKRQVTFYDQDQVCHIAMEEPFCKEMRDILSKTMDNLGIKYHSDKTVITIEGPKFSTKAESKMHRAWGADIINMSTVPECVLARESGLCYQAIAMSTDYDCFMEHEENVTWEQIVKVMNKNADNVKKVMIDAIPNIVMSDCGCKSAISSALVGEPMKEKNVPEQLKSLVRTIPDWPKKGIQFRDITTLLNDPKGYHLLIEELTKRYKDNKPDVIAGIEARGFILGGALAYTLGVGFVPIRKKGKLPGETVSQEYELEYGTDKIEMHKDAIKPGQKVLIVDDLIATAGTSIAAVKLVKQLGGNILECVFIIELPELQGRAKLEKECKKIFCLFEFEGE